MAQTCLFVQWSGFLNGCLKTRQKCLFYGLKHTVFEWCLPNHVIRPFEKPDKKSVQKFDRWILGVSYSDGYFTRDFKEKNASLLYVRLLCVTS